MAKQNAFIRSTFRNGLSRKRLYPNSSRRVGFTLIELLVVISIVSLLIAILLPALGNARVASQRVVSVANARQITTAQLMYANDFDSSMPLLKQASLNDDGTGSTHDRWRPQWSKMLVEMGYLSSASVYWSPGREKSYASGIEDERPEMFGQTRPTAYSYESVGYGMNVGVAGGTGNNIIEGSADPPLRLSDNSAPPPSDMLLLAESWTPTGIHTATPLGSRNGMYSVGPTKFNQTNSSRLFNYNGAVVRSYLDGRAHAMEGSELRVSGHPSHAGNSDYTLVDTDELGWDVNREPPSGFELAGPYAGYWSHSSRDDGWYCKPWYVRWRTRWYADLR